MRSSFRPEHELGTCTAGLLCLSLLSSTVIAWHSQRARLMLSSHAISLGHHPSPNALSPQYT